MTGPGSTIAIQPPLAFRPRGATVTYEHGTRAEQFRREWEAFAAAHPDVVDFIVGGCVYAAQMYPSRVIRLKAIFESTRAELKVSINNNWPSVAGEWIEERHPEFLGMFPRKRRPAEERAAKPRSER